MKILVDTSLWSMALRRKKDIECPEADFIKLLITNNETIIITGIILQEILSGIKNRQVFEEIKNILRYYPYYEANIMDYLKAADLRNQCKTKGVQAGTIDALIAAIAINNDFLLASRDKDFFHIAKHSELALIDEESYWGFKIHNK